MKGIRQLAKTMNTTIRTLDKRKFARLFIETTSGTYAISQHAITMYQAEECDIRVALDGLDMTEATLDIISSYGDYYVVVTHKKNDTMFRIKLERVETIQFRERLLDKTIQWEVWYRDGKIANWIIQREEEEDAEDRANRDWERGREASWDAWEEVHYGGTQ